MSETDTVAPEVVPEEPKSESVEPTPEDLGPQPECEGAIRAPKELL